jgi:Cd2+/Zn2+-exporting ATPase
MVTGDNPARADQVSAEIGEVDKVYAGLLPDEKLQTIENLKKQGKVLYVGDGINDAPVMTIADCSFSMGKIGSGAAIEASDIVVVSDNLSALPLAVRIAKKTRAIATENLIFSLVAKLALMVLSLTCGLLLSIAVLGDVGVMLLAVLNSLRMRMKMK